MNTHNPWAVADQISGGIVYLVNAELDQMREKGDPEPLQLLVGQLLALMALEKIMPPRKPGTLDEMFVAVKKVLLEVAK